MKNPIRKVYLGSVDVGFDSKLELSNKGSLPTDEDVMSYIFRYGLLADQVLMQGSAPLKSRQILLVYMRLAEAFRRNENHQPIPIFGFALSEQSDGYLDYIYGRLNLLRAANSDNPERVAYEQNDGIDAAARLDSDLMTINVPRRARSASKPLRQGMLSFLRANNPLQTGIEDETAEKAIYRINESDLVQTFELVAGLKLRELKQVRALYLAARGRYRQANAMANEATSSDESPVWSSMYIAQFLDAIGMGSWLMVKKLDAGLLFKIRRIESFCRLREEYFFCQSSVDIEEFLLILKTLRLDGRVVSVLRQSPSALVALIFEALNEAKWGSKALNKAGEIISKTILSDSSDRLFAKRCYRLHGLVEQLREDMSGIVQSSS